MAIKAILVFYKDIENYICQNIKYKLQSKELYFRQNIP